MRQEMTGFGDGSGISWTICKQSAPRSRQITKPTPHHSIVTGWMFFLTPNQQCQSTEGTRCNNCINDFLKNKTRKTSDCSFVLTVRHGQYNSQLVKLPPKYEVQQGRLRRQRRPKPQTYVTCTKNLVKIRSVVSEMWLCRQTHRQTRSS